VALRRKKSEAAAVPRLQLGMPWGPTDRRPARPGLPFVFLNVAMTADGKIAPASRHFEPFSSRRDRLLMYELRSYAEGVMSGARTLDLNPVKLGNGGEIYTQMRLQHGLADHPVRIVVSGRATIDPAAEVFKHRFSPIIVLACGAAPERRLQKLRGPADEVAVFGEEELDFVQALDWLRKKWGIRSLLCEGGGEVNGALFAAGLVDELYLTLCPVIFGGRDAPTPADGHGVQNLAEATQLKLRRMKRVGDEFFLIYRVIRAASKRTVRTAA
jgi:riboflavin-specific deaminase-like protein